MIDFLPREVREGLEIARKKALRSKARLRVRVGAEAFPILKMWDEGFALDRANTDHLRGLVDIYDGSKHLYQVLIVATQDEENLRSFDFKRVTAALDKAPLDYVKRDDAPVGYLPLYQ